MKFTMRSVETIEARNGRFFAWDNELRGFGLRVEASGRKTFVCRYRVGGTRRQYTIGRFGVITVDQARQEARRILGSVSLGDDPGAVRQAGRSAIRFRDLVEAFLEGHGPRLKPGIKPACAARAIASGNLFDRYPVIRSSRGESVVHLLSLTHDRGRSQARTPVPTA